VGDDTTAAVIQRFYDAGVFPDWWKLEPMRSDAGWSNACAAITRNDAHTRGIVVLGLGSDMDALAASFDMAARHPLVKGFAVGRTIFAEAAQGFMAGTMGAAEAVAMMTDRYARLCALWDAARASAEGVPA
jgi:5-dehydro-2-deoxygluconokinase